MHAREIIRTAFVTALLNNTTAGANVYSGGVFQVYDGLLPAIFVATRSEETDIDRGRVERVQYRALTITCHIYDKATADIDSSLDDIAAEVETIIFTDPNIINLCHCLDLPSTEIEVSNEGEKEIAVCILSFELKFMTEKGKPEVLLI